MRFFKDRSGAGMLEYGLILGLVALVSVAVLLLLGGDTNSSLNRSANRAPGGAPIVSPAAP
jgi:Flp pilus assembly pilin Flp